MSFAEELVFSVGGPEESLVVVVLGVGVPDGEAVAVEVACRFGAIVSSVWCGLGVKLVGGAVVVSEGRKVFVVLCNRPGGAV